MTKELLQQALELLSEIASTCTRDDDLPDGILNRIDALQALAQQEALTVAQRLDLLNAALIFADRLNAVLDRDTKLIKAQQEQPAQEQYPLPDSLYPGSKDWMAGSYKERVEWLHGMYESAKQEIARLEAQQEQPSQEPVMYQYRWLNPGDNPDQPESELEWKLVEVRNVYTDTIANRIDELRGYRFNGKPVYEVRPLYAAPPTQSALSEARWNYINSRAVDMSAAKYEALCSLLHAEVDATYDLGAAVDKAIEAAKQGGQQ